MKLPFFKNVQGETYSRTLAKKLAGKGVALEHDYEVWYGIEDRGPLNVQLEYGGLYRTSLDNDSLDSKGVLLKKELLTVSDVSLPKLGYTFTDDEKGAGFINAMVEQGVPVLITYWDSSDLAQTRQLTNQYLAQFSKYETLRMEYKENWLTIRTGDIVITLTSGAWSRPMSTNVGNGNGLMKFVATFHYEQYTIENISRLGRGVFTS